MIPLVLVEKSPLPATSGSRTRILHLLRAVASISTSGDLVILGDVSQCEKGLLDQELPGWHITSVPIRKDAGNLRRRLEWLRRRELPTQLAVLDVEEAAARVRSLLGDDARLLVALRATPAAVARSIRRFGDRVVYDLDDAEDVKLRRSIDERSLQPEPLRPRWWWGRVRDFIDIRAWWRFQSACVVQSDLTLVCSTLDLERYTMGRTMVVPNGSALHPMRARDASHKNRRMLFLGQLGYGPNERAAVRLAERVLPLVRAVVPETTARLVGAHSERVRALGDLTGVEVTGFVDQLDDEWGDADVLVVPLSSGGGTRLKILEALGRGVPVVSTSIGAEGIEGVDGIHFRIADSDSEMAAAVIEILQDPATARRMAERGQELVRERYQWTVIEEDLAEALRRLVS